MTHALDFTSSWTKSKGVDLSTTLSFNIDAEFKPQGVGAGLGFGVANTTTFSNSYTYGESVTHHFDLQLPPPPGSGQGGVRTRDYYVDYRGALWAWSGKLRAVVYDDADYSVRDNSSIPPADPNIFIFEFDRSVKSDVFTEHVVSCVPEPATWLLLITEVLILSLCKRTYARVLNGFNSAE
jgi:hypothetical protein